MKIVSLKENTKTAELAKSLARKGKMSANEALGRLLVANPQLEKTGSIPAGAAVIVPTALVDDAPAVSAPGQEPLLAMVRDLQSSLPDLQVVLKAAVAEGGKQQEEFRAMVADRLSGQQADVPAAELRKRMATVDKRAKLMAQEADEQQFRHAKMLKQVGHDLTAFLNRHAAPAD